ncbi:MAG: hypothetical protein HDQ97_13985 [Lachnospiraceae bacterium]|nr:hypothetical protein [Lachnospiraceae bacterium]
MKKHICVAISVLFILSLQGCGNSGDSHVTPYEDAMAETERDFNDEAEMNTEETADAISIKSDSAEVSEEIVVTQSEETTEASVQDGKVKEKKRLQKWESYYADGRLADYGIYSYDSEGNAKEQVYDSGSSFGDSLKWTHTYSYDNEGNVTQEQHFVNEDDIPLWYIIYSYDNHGNLSKEQQFNADGSPSDYYYIYNYDNQGNLIERQDFALDGTLFSCCIYSYDEQGNRILEQCYVKIGDDEQASIYYIYSYDDEGNMTKSEFYDAFGNLDMYTIYTY